MPSVVTSEVEEYHFPLQLLSETAIDDIDFCK